ncbi:cyclin-dependent kinase 2-interacting protein-like isoform X2 [Periplaneta americana]|uniref:cyclin-dependent kinase 2-interacting protein-like isoform X2 n=1 Tax=Periplaneta americana TaxID=6978 RepID=UPI0037E712BE
MCSTPSNKSSTSPHFSPVTVKDSPVKKIHQCGNLTGNCRRLRDLAAELFNLIQEWNTQHLLGVQIVKSIMNLKHPVLIGCDMGSSTQTYPDGLQELCDELSEIVLIMERVVEKMEVIPRQMRSVATLEKLNSMNKAPLFLTWPSEKFDVYRLESEPCLRHELFLRASRISQVSKCETAILTYVMDKYIIRCETAVSTIWIWGSEIR